MFGLVTKRGRGRVARPDQTTTVEESTGGEAPIKLFLLTIIQIQTAIDRNIRMSEFISYIF